MTVLICAANVVCFCSVSPPHSLSPPAPYLLLLLPISSPCSLSPPPAPYLLPLLHCPSDCHYHLDYPHLLSHLPLPLPYPTPPPISHSPHTMVTTHPASLETSVRPTSGHWLCTSCNGRSVVDRILDIWLVISSSCFLVITIAPYSLLPTPSSLLPTPFSPLPPLPTPSSLPSAI